jgi:aspartyl aminopeptidase
MNNLSYPIEFIDIQEVVVHNDSACGSTIGPMVSAKLGQRIVDLGMPQLSMHSNMRCAAPHLTVYHANNIMCA